MIKYLTDMTVKKTLQITLFSFIIILYIIYILNLVETKMI